MAILRISSLQHPLIKHLIKLREQRSYRYEHNQIVLEGKKVITEILPSHSCQRLFITENSVVPEGAADADIYLVTQAVMDKISGTMAPEGIVAQLALPAQASLNGMKRVLAFDGVSDPGNIGTLLRTALAFGWEGVYFIDGCCDPYNDKALRAAKGATLRLPMRFGSWSELETLVQQNSWTPLAADVEGEEAGFIDVVKPLLLVLGNEAHGLSPEAKRLCRRVTIPIDPQMESLNVAIAAGILMYALQRRKS